MLFSMVEFWLCNLKCNIQLTRFCLSWEKILKSREKSAKSWEKIVALLSKDGKLSAVLLAEKIGISAKAVEKHLSNLKVDGIIERVGPAKGGYWKVK